MSWVKKIEKLTIGGAGDGGGLLFGSQEYNLLQPFYKTLSRKSYISIRR